MSFENMHQNPESYGKVHHHARRIIYLLTLCYNITQFAILAVFWPVLLLLILVKRKYRRHLPARLGLGLAQNFPPLREGQPTFWVHGLSVGEITSAAPLVVGLRTTYPKSHIVVTAATETGLSTANSLLHGVADQILSSPLDLLPVVNRFISRIQPDLFILVETDFWPNLLAALHRRHHPILLVNGRISHKSFTVYNRFSWFFVPMFQRFDHICMQTERDRQNMKDLGLIDEKLHILGNLKFAQPATTSASSLSIFRHLPENRLVFVAGSTHRGEEQFIFQAYRELRSDHPDFYLVLVPRNTERAEEILELGGKYRLRGIKRSAELEKTGDYLLVDTIGELVDLYRSCHIAFVGGSLVAEGGHNPIEPASMSKPVLFGPHMEDFEEIAAALVAAGGALVVPEGQQLCSILKGLIADEDLRSRIGTCASACTMSQQGVITRHLELIASLL